MVDELEPRSSLDPEQFGPHPTVTVDEPITLTEDSRPPAEGRLGSGGTVADAMLVGTLDEARLRSAMAQLAQAVQALHDAGLLHLDIKPGNILVDRSGRVVLLDFGLVRELRVDEGLRDHVLGTPAYMAPEQAAGGIAGPAADWYAVGGVLYRSLTGRLPFLGSSIAVMLAKQTERPVAPSALAAGVPPDLDQLCLELLATDPADRPTGPEILARLGVERSAAHFDVPDQPLLGRGRELEALREAYGGSRDACTICHVAGISGMGKSALLRHFLSELTAESTVLRGRCHQRESVPYKAFDELMDGLALELARSSWLGVRTAEEDAIRDLARLFPTFRELLPGEGAEMVEPLDDAVEARRRAFRALHRLMSEVARRRPLVLAIDDVQWADHDSARLLDDLLSAPVSFPLLILLAYRSNEADRSPLLRQLERAAEDADERWSACRVEVGPLDETAASELIESLAPQRARRLDAGELVQEAEGSPLFLEQLVRHALAEPGDVDEPSGELSLSALIGAQLRALSEAERRLLTTVALLGRPVELGLALAASDVEASRAFGLVRQLEGRYLIRSHGPGLLDLVEVHHDRVREVVEQRLEHDAMREAHARIARTLGDAADVPPDQLAEHLHGAGMLAEAALAAATAAERAAASLAFEHAAALYLRAIQWLGGTEPEVRKRWERSRAEALANAGRAEEAAQAMLALAADASQDEAFSLETRAAEMLLACGLIERGTEVIEPLARSIGLPLPGSDAKALLELVGHMARTRVLGTRFATDASPPPDIARQLELCLAMGKGFAAFNPVLSGVFWLRGLRLALRHGDRFFASRALAQFGLMTMYSGNPSAVKRGEGLLRQAEELERPLHDTYLRGTFALSRGLGATACGDWARSLEHIEQGLALYDRNGHGARFERTAAETTYIPDLLWRGQFPLAMQRAVALRRMGDDVGDLFSGVFGEVLEAHATLARGDVVRARRLTARARARWTREHFTPLHVFIVRVETMCDLAENMPTHALTQLEEAWPDISAGHMLGFQIWRIELGLLRAGCRAARAATHPADRKSVARRLRRDARSLEREGRTWARATAGVVEASAAALEGRLPACRSALDRAATAYREADMPSHAASVDLRRAHLEPERAGVALRERAVTALADMGVEEPSTYARAVVPGWFGED